MSATSEARPNGVSSASTTSGFQPLPWRKAVLLVLGAAVCFHAAYTPAHPGPLALLIVGYVVCLVQLARLRTTRLAFYAGLVAGLACIAPQLAFFWSIFGAAAIALWTVLAFWIALFVALTHVALVRFGAKRAVWLIPFLWTGLEYFRSELYYLKFAWLNVGFAFGFFQPLGVYGWGFCVAALAAVCITRWYLSLRSSFVRILIYIAIIIVLSMLLLPALSNTKSRVFIPNFRVAGVQLEFPNSTQIKQSLDQLLADEQKDLIEMTNKYLADHKTVQPAEVPVYLKMLGLLDRTQIKLIILPEYTLDGPPTEQLKNWCRENRKFLIVGGKDPAPGNNYYNTAFVISTNGEVVFKQVKSVPIQFFKDGLPAPEQKLWASPWGKIGICICYDLCYTRVTDELVRQGAQMIIAPTMDVADWGRHQHELHARVAPVRAAEYGIPIFRLASSGISQGVTGSGVVRATAPFPGEGEMIFFGVNLNPRRHGSLPLDCLFAPWCVGVTGLFVVWLAVNSWRRKKKL